MDHHSEPLLNSIFSNNNFTQQKVGGTSCIECWGGAFSIKLFQIKGKFFKKWANPGLFFVYFRSFLITISIQIEKSVDGVLRTWGHRMVGTEKTTELWWPPN